MVTSQAELHGTALVGHGYHVDIRAEENGGYSSDIRIVEGVGAGPIAHHSRSPLRAVADFIGNHVKWSDKYPTESSHLRFKLLPDSAIEHNMILEENARNIKDNAQEVAGRIPRSKERLAMAELQSKGQGIAHKLHHPQTSKCAASLGQVTSNISPSLESNTKLTSRSSPPGFVGPVKLRCIPQRASWSEWVQAHINTQR
ncbi:hypothetical protein IQ06DRAFT_300597 [Phaeosphaeriaceae sp. SRC1lsM3a]|nr:hypothetical protein IQ06DRAFT_300597 [Stagonospora sp. SRC1lsM3a]